MPAAYSFDLRKKAINAVDDGIPLKMIADNLNINISTLVRWMQKERVGKGFSAEKTGRKIGSGRKISAEDFKKYVEKNPNKTATQIAKELNISVNTACINMKRINYTFKKKRFQILGKMKTIEKTF